MNAAVLQELKNYIGDYQALKADLQADFNAIMNLPASDYYYCVIKNLSVDQCPGRMNKNTAANEIFLSIGMYFSF